MKRFIFFFIILSLLYVNWHLFWENKNLRGEVVSSRQERESQRLKFDESAANSRLLGLFFRCMKDGNEADIQEFSDAVDSSGDEELKIQYKDLFGSNSAEALVDLGNHINENNLKIFNK